MVLNKAVFLDRDGVINVDRVDYVYEKEQFILIEGVKESLEKLKASGFRLIVVTNQSGIAKGIYSHGHVLKIHDHLRQLCPNLIDAFYYAPWHPDYSESLTRKPGTLMFERAIARFNIDPSESWMLGDKETDLIPAKKMGIKTIQIDLKGAPSADIYADSLQEAARMILDEG